jgi:hypothetical protein
VDSPGSWDEALACLSSLGEYIRRRPILKEAAALLARAEPCLNRIEALASELDEKQGRALRTLARSMQSAIFLYTDYENDSVEAGRPSQTFRKRRAEERDELWRGMLDAFDVLIDDLTGRAQ